MHSTHSASPSPTNTTEHHSNSDGAGESALAWIAAPIVILTILLLLTSVTVCICLIRRMNRKRVRIQPHVHLELGPIPGVPLSETASVTGTTSSHSIINGSTSDPLLDDLDPISGQTASSRPPLGPKSELKSDWTFDAIEDLGMSSYLTQGDHDVIVTRQSAYPMYAKISTPPRTNRARKVKDQTEVSHERL